MLILKSAIDASVNFVNEQEIGFLEARYVRRSAGYAICYLSSQTGCNRGCKFCHLTATNQTAFRDATLQDYLDQADTVIDYYKRETIPCKVANLNFMGRGEILANKHFLEDATSILSALGTRFLEEGLTPKFNLSTIMPATLKKSLVELFPLITPTLYYSFYSTDPVWRKEWMPAAMPYGDALDLLQEYQKISRKIIKIHGAFIENENDSPADIGSMIDALDKRKLYCELNIVEYNPLTSAHGRGSPRLGWIKEKFERHGFPTKIISAVGKDCGASCGSFYPVHDLTLRDLH